MARVKLVLVATTALVLATAAAAAAATNPQVAHTAAGTKLAQTSLLRLGDFGTGWTQEAATGPTTGLNFACPGVTPKQNDVVEIGAADSPAFKATAVGPAVQQRTSAYENPKAAATLWQRGVKPRLMDCVAQTVETVKSRGIGVTINDREMLKLGAIGDGSVGYRIVATLVGKQRLKTYFDVVVLRGGQTITQLTISAYQKPPPLKWEIALTKIAARRIGAAGNVA
jgi:hypothetical protein